MMDHRPAAGVERVDTRTTAAAGASAMRWSGLHRRDPATHRAGTGRRTQCANSWRRGAHAESHESAARCQFGSTAAGRLPAVARFRSVDSPGSGPGFFGGVSMLIEARIVLLQNAASCLDEFARDPVESGSLEEARRDEAVLVANGLRNLVAELRAEAE